MRAEIEILHPSGRSVDGGRRTGGGRGRPVAVVAGVEERLEAVQVGGRWFVPGTHGESRFLDEMVKGAKR